MRTKTTKAKLAAGQVVFGAIISRHAPDLVALKLTHHPSRLG